MTRIDKEAFIASVVHDLRAPLNACLMSLSLLELKASQPAEVLKAAEVVRRNLDRQAKLIEDLADVLQIAGNGLELAPEPADLADIMDAAAEKRSGAATLRWIGERPSVAVEADPKRLAQALAVLLDVLCESAEPGDGVGLEADAAGGRLRVAARLERSGPTTGPEEPSRRKRSAMRLAIVEHVLERHGGSVEIDDAGPAFTVELPVRQSS